MSQQSVIQFFDAVFQNKQLQGQLNYGIAEFAPEILLQIAKENGYSFLTEDLKAVLEKQTELSDKQLEAVAGGRASEKFIDFTQEPVFCENILP